MSSYQKQLSQYRQQSVAGASPLRLVLMLYDAALRHLSDCKTAMSAKDRFKQNDEAQAAQAALGELIASLDQQAGGNVAKNLAGLYTYIYQRSVQANLQDSEEFLDECIELLTELRESWAELEKSGVDREMIQSEDEKVA